ncbi:MAG: SRPBCC family protein [Actinomycetota bacterium]|nr:SRPBCC family protein [Actinomycetota bacterium]
MRIDNSFTVALPVDDAWKVLLDVERIAPCMPGAELQEITEDEYRGVVKVKLGAITAQYKGAVRFAEVDEPGRRLVLSAEGRETRGQGNASATVTARLRPADESRTEVVIETELTISGRIAQFGRGVLADVSSKLLGEFAKCLEKDLLSGRREPAPAATPEEVVADEIGDVAVENPERAAQLVSAVTQGTASTASVTRTVESKPAEPVDLLAVAGGSVAERAVPAAIVGILVLQVLPKGRMKRLGLAVLGSALVAGMVAGKKQQ